MWRIWPNVDFSSSKPSNHSCVRSQCVLVQFPPPHSLSLSFSVMSWHKRNTFCTPSSLLLASSDIGLPLAFLSFLPWGHICGWALMQLKWQDFMTQSWQSYVSSGESHMGKMRGLIMIQPLKLSCEGVNRGGSGSASTRGGLRGIQGDCGSCMSLVASVGMVHALNLPSRWKQQE